MLLIRKKRGLGAGKINGPGGKIEPGETPLQAATRETTEELGIVPHGLELAGDLRFQFLDGLAIECQVFRAMGYTGVPIETEEAIPLWYSVDQLPYEEMWSDDLLWLPLLLQGKPFQGRFVFDGDQVLSSEIND